MQLFEFAGAPGEIRTHDLCLRDSGRITETARSASRHSEMSANLLNGWTSNFRTFSECALINNANHLDFDSATSSSNPLCPNQAKTPRNRALFVDACLPLIPNFYSETPPRPHTSRRAVREVAPAVDSDPA
jgi:hypothetical protein